MGSFATVLLVQYLPENKLYAMKVISKEIILQKRLMSSVYSEYHILQQVDNRFLMGLEFAFQTVLLSAPFLTPEQFSRFRSGVLSSR